MPNIPVTLQETPALQPTELGIQARTQAAYRGRALFDQAAQAISRAGQQIGSGIASAGQAAVNYFDHQQINAGAAKGADLFAYLTQSWNQTVTNADPHDPSVAQKWREEVLNPALDQFQTGFSTEKSVDWASRFTNNLRQHMFEKTEGDMSSLAAAAVATTVRDLANRFSNTAISDPTAVPAMLGAVDHSIDGIVGANPNLKGAAAGRVRSEVGQKIKEEIVKAGAYGVISNAADPEAAAKNYVARYPDFINGVEAETFARAAKAQNRANTAAQKQAVYYQKQIDSLNVEKARNKIWDDNVQVDTSGKVNINPNYFREVVKIPSQYPNAPNATDTARTLLDWGEHQQKTQNAVTDPTTADGLDSRMFAPDNPTTAIDILKAEAAGKLSRQDGTIRMELVKERDQSPIRDPLFKDAIAAAKSLIVLPGSSGVGSEKFVGFMRSFMGEYLKESRAGTLPPNALDLNDPNSLIYKMAKTYGAALSTSVPANGGVGAANTVTRSGIPESLRGIAALQWIGTGSNRKYRDQMTGRVYDADGKEIKR